MEAVISFHERVKARRSCYFWVLNAPAICGAYPGLEVTENPVSFDSCEKGH